MPEIKEEDLPRAVLLTVEGPLAAPGVVGRNGTQYTKEAIEQMVAKAKETMKHRRFLSFKKFEDSNIEAAEGIVQDIKVEEDGKAVAKVDIIESEPGKVVADIIREGKKSMRLAWCVLADEKNLTKENDVVTVHKMDLQSLSFTDDHSFDVDPVKKVE